MTEGKQMDNRIFTFTLDGDSTISISAPTMIVALDRIPKELQERILKADSKPLKFTPKS